MARPWWHKPVMNESFLSACSACGGDGGFEIDCGTEWETGAPQTVWEVCELCKGFGEHIFEMEDESD